MNHEKYPDAYIRSILERVETIAMVGASANSARPSFLVLKYLSERGYRMLPINPGLAGKLELDAAALENTVADFNAAVRPGTFDHTVLDDCRTEGLTPPKTHWARRIERAPFYAYPVRPGITFTYLSTRVNKQARMLMKDGKPSANMFAAGEIMSGNVLGKGYAAGMGMTIGSVFGRIAGREAARNARN